MLKQRLYTFRMNECEHLRDHITQFVNLLNDLNNVEVHINDEDQAMLLLCSLPPSYKSFRETLIYDKDNLSFKDVKGHLLRKAKLDNEFNSNNKLDKQASVFVASRKRDKRCCYCKNNEEDLAGVNLADDKGDDFLLVSTSENFELTSEWILDLRCSFHIFSNIDWFSTYSPVEGGVVRMGNGSPSKVIDIGTFQIKMHDGIIRTLLDVKHVPNLKKNLISLGILDSKGCIINTESNKINVSRGALILMKGKNIDSLYVREGSTVTGEIRRLTSIKELKSICFKRRQFCHSREKCMTVSYKRGSLLVVVLKR
ncbi:hypothetical protein Goshw_025025 [Gossypium schwendimanii]|uniref:Retrovirus-related Pol polyprotein from transposon TNT 1-94-like beta-barrel domain-containing protein n=1 Tax=Gossypium schwendimanii TaxID=34291 RepID=A0A7J9N1G5_GOSSC|nr:hypothetical protein [Gossypium schwendimanii]